jgi:O-antigen/teichoic acid export membrane protein
MSVRTDNLVGGRRLARNVLWNLMGTGAPFLMALVAIPLLIDGLGIARFGVLTIAWMVVGYFSLFDMGLGRALTKLVAERLGQGRDSEIPALVWTAMSMMTVLGVLGAVTAAALTPWLVTSVLNIPTELQPETLIAFYLLAIAIPIVLGGTGLRGILEAHQRFDLVNVVRIPLGILTFLGPLAVLSFSSSLVPVVGVLVIARLTSWCAYAILSFRVEPSLGHSVRISRQLIRPLINFGGWITVTNVVGPLMVYMDRFLIGAIISMEAVAYYATPYEMVTKLWIIPGALMGVVFPAFAVLSGDRLGAARLFRRTVRYIFLCLFPVVLVIVTFAHEGLTLWLGGEFAENSSLILQILAVGVFINSHAYVPSGLLQGTGRPDLNAKLHLIELPIYLTSLWFVLDAYGIVGVAFVWAVRVAVDNIALFVMAHGLVPSVSPFSLRPVLIAATSLFVLLAGAMMTGVVVKGVFVLLVLPLFAATAWLLILAREEKNMILSRVGAILTARHSRRE